MTTNRNSYLFVDADLVSAGRVEVPDLHLLTDRHKYNLDVPTLQPISNAWDSFVQEKTNGLIIELSRGWVSWWQLQLIKRVIKSGRAAWLYWPGEEAIERVDMARVQSLFRHWAVVRGWNKIEKIRGRVFARNRVVDNQEPEPLQRCFTDLSRVHRTAMPIELPFSFTPSESQKISGTGLYLRTDYWAPIESGGSYGHTCYVAKELARVTEQFLCLMPHRYTLLDEMGVKQLVMDPPCEDSNEISLMRANLNGYKFVKEAIADAQPAYLYERLCLGNFVGAKISQEYEIPYIVEYNGSEISMMKSFGNGRYAHEEEFLRIEDAAFKQATLISVVSEPIRDELIKRNINPEKIVVNPNGVDLSAYSPGTQEEKESLRAKLGWNSSHRVVGFTGTFGGWHGIPILAEAIPLICQKAPDVKFLFIGDGNLKHLVDEQIRKHALYGFVQSLGRISQQEGAKWLRACDIYVSPHNSHMVNSKFFGSPTKIFEYMAMGGGIVASDLEQIGEVLSPALRLMELPTISQEISDQRSILCQPGSVEEFVEAVVWLVEHPQIQEQLGQNARKAAEQYFSWEQHTRRLWEFSQQGKVDQKEEPSVSSGGLSIALQDRYKQQTQKQWDNDPCGSHYVKQADQHSIEWFQEAENYRYQDYAPWMQEVMEFTQHPQERVLEVGGGMGTDLSQFARHGALVTDLDLSLGHLNLARENFSLRGLSGNFLHADAETFPFKDDSFDVVYSNGVIHHTPNTHHVVQEIHRVLKPGGKTIVMVYAETSLHYWVELVWKLGVRQQMLEGYSMGEVLSRHVEISENGAKPLVKVYSKGQLRDLFKLFSHIKIYQRQLIQEEIPHKLQWIPLDVAGKMMGWNYIIKASKAE